MSKVKCFAFTHMKIRKLLFHFQKPVGGVCGQFAVSGGDRQPQSRYVPFHRFIIQKTVDKPDTHSVCRAWWIRILFCIFQNADAILFSKVKSGEQLTVSYHNFEIFYI
jgi:hypothetical protein